MYKVEFTSSAAIEFRSLTTQLKRRIAPILDSLSQDPRPVGVRKLAGYENLYRVRIGQYRVIYEVNDDNLIIRVTRVRHRREAYR